MPSGTELRVLEIVDDAGGTSTPFNVSRQLRMDTNYGQLLCLSLAKADYLDLKASGKVVLTSKGKSVLKR